jgi:hypothetical protein
MLECPALSGRVFGPQMYRRLQRSIETLHRVAEWNARNAAALEQAWLDEAEKRAAWEQQKRAR